MALEDLTNQPRQSPFSEEDRVDHMRKMVARTFGVEASDLGAIEVVEDRPYLVIEHAGKTHRLTWRAMSRGPRQWFVEGREQPIRLSGGNNPLQRLREALEA